MKIITSILFLILFQLTSCKPLQEASITGIEGFNAGKISMDGINGEITIKIKNPNNVGFTIYPSEFDISLGDVKMGKAKLNKKVRIGPNLEKTYTFKLNANMENINLMDLMGLINSGGSKKITLNGNLKAGKFLIKRKYPVSYSERIKF